MKEDTAVTIVVSSVMLAFIVLVLGCVKGCEYENVTQRERMKYDIEKLNSGFVRCTDKDGYLSWTTPDRCRQ